MILIRYRPFSNPEQAFIQILESPSNREPKFLVIIFKGHGLNNLIEIEFQTDPLETHVITLFEYATGHFQSRTGLYKFF